MPSEILNKLLGERARACVGQVVERLLGVDDLRGKDSDGDDYEWKKRFSALKRLITVFDSITMRIQWIPVVHTQEFIEY